MKTDRSGLVRWLRTFLVGVVVIAVLAVSGCSRPTSTQGTSASSTAESPKELNPDIKHKIDDALQQAMTAASVPGVILGIWGPNGYYEHAYGVADKATGAPMQTSFYSRIGSVTKTFTITGVLQLVDQNKVGLDDPIAKYIDGVPHGDAITLRQLARMQSGLANYTDSPDFQQAFFANPRRPFSPQQLLGYAFSQPTTFAPGENFQYCNTNTILLGLVVEKVSGQPLPDYIHDHILSPLGMSQTSFPTTSAFGDPHAQGYTNQTADGKETTATDWDPSWAWSAGAMISTLGDLHTWAPALATGKLLSPHVQEQRLQTVSALGLPPPDGYGLGIFNLAGWIGHNGSLPGYQSVVVYQPETQQTLVILSNTDISYQGNEPSTSLANAVTKVLTPDHVYSLSPQVQQPSSTPSPSPSKPR
ncbi:MAG: D-alanyl-D-alanine carboxypeptidase [Mycobacterium sp.]|jgi:D-alanyl-D-alanine carboxypeptidase|nr:D-alanyl-D-alanine carboxypeptidase [Mycobacterium sp.]